MMIPDDWYYSKRWYDDSGIIIIHTVGSDSDIPSIDDDNEVFDDTMMMILLLMTAFKPDDVCVDDWYW